MPSRKATSQKVDGGVTGGESWPRSPGVLPGGESRQRAATDMKSDKRTTFGISQLDTQLSCSA